MAFRVKKTPEPILSDQEESASFTVRYPLGDLSCLKPLRDRSRVSAREWFPMGGGPGQRKLDKFEELIREAIAILIKRGEIKIPPKKPPHRPGKT
jgi:hypothetical protein